jgi:CBS domain-containing protein
MDEREQPVDTRVKDVLRTKGTLVNSDVLTADPSTSVHRCVDRMVARNVGSIVVVENDHIAGIFTERDYLRNVALKDRTPEETEVQEIMTEDVATVDADTRLDACLDRMTDLQCRHLPVIDEEGRLTDIISMRDCMTQISEAAKSEAVELRNYVTGQYPR